jgi:hypothetical protein
MSDSATGKSLHLAVYDYGQGGTWLYFYARSASEIEAKYPELSVVPEAPAWLTGDVKAAVERRTYDIDDQPRGWLQSLVEGRAS